MSEKKREMTMFKVYKDTLKQVRLRAVEEEIEMQEWIDRALIKAAKEKKK